jgi:putative PIN family toxin of toxin-antitoxin system
MGAVEMTRGVLDTSVLVAGLLPGGGTGEIPGRCNTGEIRLTMSRAMLDELLRVLAYPKFRLSEGEIHYLLYAEVLPHVEIVGVRPWPAVVTADPADDMFLHCAFKARASCIVSGDRHLLRLKSYKRIKILTPSEFLSRRARS